MKQWPEPSDFNYYLVDDGTIDTVIIFDGIDFRFSPDYAAEYRDNDGALDIDALVADNFDDLLDTWDNL